MEFDNPFPTIHFLQYMPMSTYEQAILAHPWMTTESGYEIFFYSSKVHFK